MHSRLAHQAHTSCIQLASRIWGLVRRETRDHAENRQQQQVRPTLSPLHCLLYSTLLFIPRFLSLFHDFIAPYLYV
jgi:hypothetical protein